MPVFADRVRVATATTGTGTVTLGAALAGYQSFTDGGVPDGAVVSYVIEDGNDIEIGTGTFASGAGTLARNTVHRSIVSGTAGTAKLDLSGTASLFVTARGVDLARAEQVVPINVQTFTSSGTWTKPAGATLVDVEIAAGGGGGANEIIENGNAGGGAGGSYRCFTFLAVDVSASETVTIGAGGLGAATGADGDGTAGGDTSFGALLIAKGGTGGDNGSSLALLGDAPETHSTDGVFRYLEGVFGGVGGKFAGDGQNTALGGAGGGGSRGYAGGVSSAHGNGGDGNAVSGVRAADGEAPSGGGGAACFDGGGGDGASGWCRVTCW